jgi:hypothetical protein
MDGLAVLKRLLHLLIALWYAAAPAAFLANGSQRLWFSNAICPLWRVLVPNGEGAPLVLGW